LLSDSRFVLSSVLIDSESTSDFSSDAIDRKSNHGLGEGATVLGDGATKGLVVDTGDGNGLGEGKERDAADIDLGVIGRLGDTGCFQLLFSESSHTTDCFVEMLVISAAKFSGT
jgi:hypothetical protein